VEQEWVSLSSQWCLSVGTILQPPSPFAEPLSKKEAERQACQSDKQSHEGPAQRTKCNMEQHNRLLKLKERAGLA